MRSDENAFATFEAATIMRSIQRCGRPAASRSKNIGSTPLLEHVVERLGDLLVGRLVLGLADDEAGLVVRRLVPPAVEHREVQDAVHRGLHAGRAGRLARALGRVQPDVAAGHEGARERHVVVGQEDDAALRAPAAPPPARPSRRNSLPASSRGCALPGEEDLHRAADLVQEVLEPLRLAEEQRRALVRREAAREADRQRPRVEAPRGLGDLLLARARWRRFSSASFSPADGDEPRPQPLVRAARARARSTSSGCSSDAGRRDLGRRPGRRGGRRW